MLASPRATVRVAVLLLAAGVAPADTVILKNGSSFDGTIVEETEDHVVLSLSGGTLTFPRGDVVRVIRDPDARSNTPPADSPPPIPADPIPVPPARPDERPHDEPPGSVDLARVAQSPRITIDVQGLPLPDVLEELTRQAGFRFTPPFSGNAKDINLNVQDAPLWQSVLSICRQGPWGLSVVQDSSYEGLVLRIDDDDPLVTADVQGPVMFVGHGWIREHVFDATGVFAEKEGIKFSLWIDPNGRMRIVKPRLEPRFLFTFEDGRQVYLQADKETQIMLGGRSWFFFPNEKISGATADVKVRVPLYGAVALGETTLPWRGDVAATAEQAEVTIREVKSDQVETRDEKNWRKTRKIDRFAATIHVVHASGRLAAKIAEERRQPTPEEERLLAIPTEAMAVEPHEAWIVGQDGRRLRATLDEAAGITSPWHGTTTVASVRVEEPGFVPREIVFRWAHDFRHFELEFALDDVPLRAR